MTVTRLVMAVGARTPHEGGTVKHTIAINDVVLGTRKTKVGKSDLSAPLKPWTLPLDQFAGQTVTLTYSVEGAGCVGIWGAPTVLGRPNSVVGPNVLMISMDTLSPGITISVPSGSLMLPVTSVVRK